MIKFLSENWALLSFVISAIAYIYYQVIASDIWIKIPSGWIAAYYGGKKYVG